MVSSILGWCGASWKSSDWLCASQAAQSAQRSTFATFVTIVPFVWILLPFALLFVNVLCAQAFRTQWRYQRSRGNWTRFGLSLLVYAVLTFAYVYRTTGGASSVSIVDGKYVAMYKDQIIRTITDSEYKMFPNLWMRVMSAWIGMMAVFSLTQFPSMNDLGVDRVEGFNAEAGRAVRWGMPPRDWRTIYLHELATYEVVVPLFFLGTGAFCAFPAFAESITCDFSTNLQSSNPTLTARTQRA